MTVAELIQELAKIPLEDWDREVEVDLDVDYPTGHREDGAEDWIVSPHIRAITLHPAKNERSRRYITMEVVG